MTDLQSRTVLHLKAAYVFGQENGIGDEVTKIKLMQIEPWVKDYNSTVRRGYMVQLLQQKNLFEQFKAEHWLEGNTPWGQTLTKRYLAVVSEYENYISGQEKDTEDDEEIGLPQTPEQRQQFAMEAHLRDFLARNLNCIEPGLSLYQDDNQPATEFRIDGNHRIDILAVDRNNKIVVIELKLSRGPAKAVGQIAHYMAWVDQHISKSEPCRGLIIANELSEPLMYAAKRISGVEVLKYNMSVQIERTFAHTH